MKEYEMRRVILDRAYGPPDGVNPETSYCSCRVGPISPEGDEGECIHQIALRWHLEIHNPDNYLVRQGTCQKIKDQGLSAELGQIFGRACIGLTGSEIRKLGAAVLGKGV